MQQQSKHRQGRLEGLFLFVCGAALFVLIGSLWSPSPELNMIDFDAVYYASQTALHHIDPYSAPELERAYAAGGSHVTAVLQAPHGLAHAVTLCVNLPPTLGLIIPFALLPWEIAHQLWRMATAVSMIFTAFLMWRVASAWAPRFGGLMAGSLLFGAEIVLETGNAAGTAVSLCVIAAWCFMQERHSWTGVVCMALSLGLKPQDAGLIWFFFVLAGGSYRKRAWQSAAVWLLIFLVAVLWMSTISPHWTAELHANLIQTLSSGQGNDPAAKGVEPGLHSAMIISMQTVTSLFTSRPSVYSAISYALCVPLFITWGLGMLRCKGHTPCLWTGLALIVPLSLLPIYHRQHDVFMLVLTMPASAQLWARGGRVDRFVAGFTALTVLLTGSIALQFEGSATYTLRASASGLHKTWLTLAFGRPVPLLLVIMTILWLGCFIAEIKRIGVVLRQEANLPLEGSA